MPPSLSVADYGPTGAPQTEVGSRDSTSRPSEPTVTLMSCLRYLFRHSSKPLANKNCHFIGVSYFSHQNNSKKWKVLGVNHIAIATNDVKKASALYQNILKLKTSSPMALPDHGVNTIFVDSSNIKLELLDPIGETKSPIWSFLEKNKSGGIHHICLEVDDIYAAIDDLKMNGIRVLSESPKTGAHGKPVVFIHPKDCNGVLIELEQK